MLHLIHHFNSGFHFIIQLDFFIKWHGTSQKINWDLHMGVGSTKKCGWVLSRKTVV